MTITVNTTLIFGLEDVGSEIAEAARITLFSASGDSVTFTLPADPTTQSGTSISNRVIALVPLDEYTNFEQDPTAWDGAQFKAREVAQSSSMFSGVASGDYVLVWEARDQPAQNIVSRSGWSASAAVTVGAGGGAMAPNRMSAPSLAVSTLAITATLAAAPANGGSAITGYDLRYSADEATWTVLQSVTSPRAIDNLPGSTLHYVQSRAKNAIGAGAWSVSATATTGAGTPDPDPDPGDVSDDLTLANVQRLATDPTTRGVRTGVTFKVPGVDALPTGVSISGDTLTFSSSAQNVIMDGWNLFGYAVVFADGCDVTRLRDCVFGFQNNISANLAFIDIGAYATIDLWEWCSFFGPGYFGNGKGGIPCIRDSTDGSGANCKTGIISSFYRNEFFGFGADYIKPPRNGRYRFNYFDPGVNLPFGTRAWSSSTTYSVGDTVVETSSYKAFQSRTNGNKGNSLPAPKSSNTHWQALDPHHDWINPRRQTGSPRGQIWQGNYFNRNQLFGHVTGSRSADGEYLCTSGGGNNGLRNVRNNGNTDLHNGIDFQHNIVTDKSLRNISNPVEAGASSGTNQTYSIISNNWIGPKNSGEIVSSPSGHVVSGNVPYTTPSGRAAGYDGPDFQ